MEAELKEFLQKRGVPSEVIERMEDNKMDSYVIAVADEKSLEEYLPLKGDRIALRGFCRKMDKGDAASDRKKSLLSSLKRKLLEQEEDTPKKGERAHLLGNKHASKRTRKIELGWLNFDSATNTYKQVRKQKGGGTRKLDVMKEATREDIIRRAQEIFFPLGRSKLGSLEDFTFDIRDFSEDVMSSTDTVAEMYSRTAMQMLRFFLTTTPILPDSDELPDPAIPSSGSLPYVNPQGRQTTIMIQKHGMDFLSDPAQGTYEIEPSNRYQTSESLNEVEVPFSDNKPPQATVASEVSPENININTYRSSQMIPQSDSSPWQQFVDFGDMVVTTTPFVPLSLDDSENEVFFRANNNQQNLGNNQSLMPDMSPLEMNIHRGPMSFMELIGYFKDENVSKRQLMVHRILPNGEKEMAEDTGGVWRDLVSEFWSDFYERCTMGRVAKVPRLRHDFGAEEWKAVARILIHGYKFANYWPLQIARTFLQHCLEPNVQIQNSDLLADFYMYISLPDKETLQQAIEDFGSVEFDELLEALGMHDCQTSPTAENIKAILLEISHKEILQTPMYIADCWKEVLNDLCVDRKKLNEIYAALEISNKKVVQLLSFPDTMDSQSIVVSTHLKRYVRNLDEVKLGLFLRFCTGSDLPIVDKISVEFTTMEGFQRRPVAHTCSCMLQLSKFYESFMDFRTEFDNVLCSNVWVMDIV